MDEVCGSDVAGANVKQCKETSAFLPRLAISSSLADNRSIYAQASVGNNPAGVNISYNEAGNILAALDDGRRLRKQGMQVGEAGDLH